jgi:hypothetical protein
MNTAGKAIKTIEVREAGPERLWPEAVPVLEQIPLGATFHDDWNTRPPLGIYNVSLAALPRRFNAVLKCLQELTSKPLKPGPKFEDHSRELLDAHEDLLYALFEHLEDCGKLAVTFFPKVAETKREALLKQYRRALKPIDDHLGRIVNAIKHRQARLGLVEVSNELFSIPGYCVQSIVSPGLVGPDRRA